MTLIIMNFMCVNHNDLRHLRSIFITFLSLNKPARSLTGLSDYNL